SRRPMGRILRPLRDMGADIESEDGHAPLSLRPAALEARRMKLPVASAQVLSAVLLAGLNARGTTAVEVPGETRDHTERMLPQFGADLTVDGRKRLLRGPARLAGTALCVPGDLSSAAFLVAAAVLVPESKIRLEGVGVNPTRDGFLRVLERMTGMHPVARIGASPPEAGGEPIATLEVSHSSLHGVEIPRDWVAPAIDEFPVLMALAARAEGETRIRGAGELRVKESDRLAVMCEQLRRLGVDVVERDDGADVRGGTVQGGCVDAGGDHRIAMSLAVLALVAEGPVTVRGAEWIRTSYPGFVDDLCRLGAEAEWT
ncbi:MAG: 3-phosphoshikimate 1-carboxyvinyltransferase, partial [Wenzhouxiangellaceae bacterium]|nr:3-phosphoshikimate 1-carboxyvinyltransferase [Wenzhouxiangellaceae bacterium]